MKCAGLASLAWVLVLGLSSCALLRPGPPHHAPVLLPSGVYLEDVLVPEEGPVAREGDLVTLHYRMNLADGTEVDSSFDRGQPIEFRLGEGILPVGMEEGVFGLRRYGQRIVVVPAALAFGSEGLPPRIPPDAELHCLIELMDLELRP